MLTYNEHGEYILTIGRYNAKLSDVFRNDSLWLIEYATCASGDEKDIATVDRYLFRRMEPVGGVTIEDEWREYDSSFPRPPY
ncbi:MAG: hypothetical protein ACXAB9_11060 [Candidatus Thorarchaeota archaeon]|jgi:hypothetical protein